MQLARLRAGAWVDGAFRVVSEGRAEVHVRLPSCVGGRGYDVRMGVSMGAGVINLGPVEGVIVHRDNGLDPRGMPRALCQDGGGRLRVKYVHTYCTGPAAVTCPDCIEWMHA